MIFLKLPLLFSINCLASFNEQFFLIITNALLTEPFAASALYMNPFLIKKTSTLKVKAFKKGCTPSDIITSKYELVKLGKGVESRFFKGKFGSTPNYLSITPDKISKIDQFQLEDIKTVPTHYALLLIGSVNIKKAGEYIFYCGSNDGSKLYADNTLLIDNDGGHGYQEKYGKIKLDEGVHKIEVRYFHKPVLKPPIKNLCKFHANKFGTITF